MKLRNYLFENNISLTSFCKKINYDISYVSAVCREKKRPGEKLAKLIEKETNGQVTVNELMKKAG